MASRGVSPLVGVLCLLVVTVALAATVVVTVPVGSAPEPTVATFDAAADPTGEIRVTHTGGDVIDPETLDVRVRVEGEPLAEQPAITPGDTVTIRLSVDGYSVANLEVTA